MPFQMGLFGNRGQQPESQNLTQLRDLMAQPQQAQQAQARPERQGLVRRMLNSGSSEQGERQGVLGSNRSMGEVLQIASAAMGDLDPRAGGSNMQALRQRLQDDEILRQQQEEQARRREVMEQYAASLTPAQQVQFRANEDEWIKHAAQAAHREPQRMNVEGQVVEFGQDGPGVVFEGEQRPTEAIRTLEALQGRPDLAGLDMQRRQASAIQVNQPGMQMAFDDDGRPIGVGMGTEGDMPGIGRARIDAVNARRYEAQLGRRDAAQENLFTVRDLREQMETTGPGSVGPLGDLRQTGAGVIDNIRSLGAYGQGGARIANEFEQAMNDPNMDEDARNRLFDDRLSGVQYVANSLAYAEARRRNPGARLSNAMIQEAKSNMGLGGVGGDAQLNEVLRIMEQQSERELNLANQEIQSIFQTGAPSPDPFRSEAGGGQTGAGNNRPISGLSDDELEEEIRRLSGGR